MGWPDAARRLGRRRAEFNFAVDQTEDRRERVLLEERVKTRLLEMMIPSQGFHQIFPLHDYKGDAIGKRPLFIGTGTIKSQRRTEQITISRNDLHLGCALEIVVQLPERAPVTGGRQPVRNFSQHGLGSNQHSIEALKVINGFLMRMISRTQKCKEEISVSKNGFHLF